MGGNTPRSLEFNEDVVQFKIALGVICFQLDDNWEMILISTDCKILKQADINCARAFRELLALVYPVISLETEIRSHKMSVVVLSDAVSLSLIHRQQAQPCKKLRLRRHLLHKCWAWLRRLASRRAENIEPCDDIFNYLII